MQSSSGVISYTRASNFTTDANNFLVTSGGQQVLGYPAVNGVINTGSGILPLQFGAGTISPPTATGNVQLTANLNAAAAVGNRFSTPVAIYDSLGASHTLTATFTNTGANTWNYSLSIPSTDLNPVTSGRTTTPQTGILATGTLTFNGNGVLIGDTAATGGTVTGSLSNVTGIPITGFADGASNQTFDWNVLNGTNPVLTQVAAPSSTSSTEQNAAVAVRW